MKRLTSLALIFAFLGFASICYAHPPSDIIITYDPDTKVLKAVITHNVSNATNHYVKKVGVAINGREVIEQYISRQDNPQAQTVSYLVPDAKAGDVLSVEAYCSISGVLTKEIRLP